MDVKLVRIPDLTVNEEIGKPAPKLGLQLQP
jgi:hypothetical protein